MHYAEPLIRFANWRFDQASGRLFRTDESAPVCKLEPRLHQLLNYFLQHPQQIISKDQLMDDVWPAGEGTDGAVMRAVASLRKTLQPGMAGQDCIETLSKRGYRWKVELQLETQASNQSVTTAEPSLIETTRPFLPEAKPSSDDNTSPHSLQIGVLPTESVTAAGIKSTVQWTTSFWYGLMGVVLAVLVLGVFAVTLINLGKQTRLPVYSQMLTISAMAGDELYPLKHTKQQAMFYHYKAPLQQHWRWLMHDLSNHRKTMATDSFDALSQAIWLDEQHFLFQGSRDGKCHFYRQSTALDQNQPETLFACQRVFTQGLARDEQNLYWIEQDATTGHSQLWQRPIDGLKTGLTEARLLFQFDSHFRRPANLIVKGHRLYLILEKDFHSRSLFEFDIQSGQMQWKKDFSFVIHSIADWTGDNLLISSADSLLIYPLASGRVIRLNTAHGYFPFAQRDGDDIVAINTFGHGKDIFPLPLQEKPVQSAFISELSFASSKDDYAMAINTKQIAFVSERTGAAQIWLQREGRVSQLTHFDGKRQISQLLWVGEQLFGLIDLQLFQIDLQTGQLTLQPIERPARVTACEQQLFWTQWSEQGWSLFSFDQQQRPMVLKKQVTDVRCGPAGHLVLQMSEQTQLQLWSQKDDNLTSIPVEVDWRLGLAERWVTNEKGLYWLAGEGIARRLMFLGWDRSTPVHISILQDNMPDGLYADFQHSQLYYVKEKSGTADVVRLKQAVETAQSTP
jgi:DNA-binding winged helix-turn-helix (wHTH) protein